MGASRVERFHAFLIWPLELRLPTRLSGLKSGDNFVGRLSDEIRKEGVWKAVDPYDRFKGEGEAENPDLPYSEFVYFHPFAQRVLYPRKDENDPTKDEPNPALAILKRTGIREVEVALRWDETVTFDVKRVHLYLFRSQTAVVVVEVASKGSIEMDTALQFADQFRRAYAPYHETDGKCGHCPLKVKWIVDPSAKGDAPPDGEFSSAAESYQPVANPALRKAPMAGHWRWLIAPLTTAGDAKEDDLVVEQLEDDRIPSMLYMGVEDPFAVSPGDTVRLCFCDGKGNPDALPYGERFLSDFEEKNCYDRFWNPPESGEGDSYTARKDKEWRFTRFLCSGYNFAVITKASSYGLTVLDHFRHHYLQLGLLAHFHRASLLRYSRRLTEAAVPGGELKQVRREFANFINQYWFREISNQEQGKELFGLWSERLGNRELLDQLSKEAAAVDGILNLDEEDKRHLELRILTQALLWLAGLTLVVAFLDTELLRKFAEWGGWWFLGRHWDDRFRTWWPLVGLTSIGMVAGYLILKSRYRKWYPKEKPRADQS